MAIMKEMKAENGSQRIGNNRAAEEKSSAWRNQSMAVMAKIG
jgi:hypothetical protein